MHCTLLISCLVEFPKRETFKKSLVYGDSEGLYTSSRLSRDVRRRDGQTQRALERGEKVELDAGKASDRQSSTRALDRAASSVLHVALDGTGERAGMMKVLCIRRRDRFKGESPTPERIAHCTSTVCLFATRLLVRPMLVMVKRGHLGETYAARLGLSQASKLVTRLWSMS
ncbi:hypothetical protein OH76DRAFT_669524 [Lentinus brumalis]|uniref:Uncharacterized protein n=1 Tax=Lentinus brumalis TaxID=2498619 RepID=A0A371D752_9APHY|nr:hypothetical protein OH76DRAFT_669524 [Polyporus brumalis]